MSATSLHVTIELDREADGRHIAEVLERPGVIAYGQTAEEAIAGAKTLADRVVADRLEQGEEIGPGMLARIAKSTGLTPDDL
jgi:predicted RNase H-like HicB family nuclease